MKIPRTLEERLRDGHVVPFVGAGVSMAVQRPDGERLFPSWPELLGRGAKRLEEEGEPKYAALVRDLLEIDEPDYLQAAERLRAKLGPVWPTFLKKQLDPRRKDADDPSLELARTVWGLGSALLLTTNYDRVLEWACPRHLAADLDPWNIQAPAGMAEMLRLGTVPRPTVWHLHGRIQNAAGLILTPDDYEGLYSAGGEEKARYKAALAALRNLLASRSLLFIGFSLDDPHFRVQLSAVADLFEGCVGPHYALVHRRDQKRLRRSELPVRSVPFEDFGEPLVELVQELGRCAATEKTAELSVDSVAADEGEEEPDYDVFLAAVADTLQELRGKVQDELERKGVEVADKVPPPFDAEPHRERVLTSMRESRLSVHLLDHLAGSEIHDAPGTTYPQEQVLLGREHARSQLVWVADSAKRAEGAQKDLLAELEHGVRGASAHEFHRGMSSDLVSDILGKLGQPTPKRATAPPPAVLLDTHEKDEALVRELSQTLLAHSIHPYINPLKDDPRQNLGFLKERLQRVAALVVFHGQVDGEWVCARLEEAIKIVVSDRCPLTGFYVYLAPPENKETEAYERYRFLNFHLLDNRRGFDSTTLEPLFTDLGRGEQA